jgi:NitT/TauT family transport system permease protein
VNVQRAWSGPFMIGALSLGLGAVVWQIAATAAHSVLFPTLFQTLETLQAEVMSGRLAVHVGVSLQRVVLGWGVGGVFGVLLGLAMGSFAPVRWFFEPLVQFLRFVPAIAWITPFTIWAGVGELSKFMLICYGSTFMVMLNAMAGVYAVNPNKLRAARCYGANAFQVFVHVTFPATVPFVVTGLRVSLGNAFMMLIAAEMLAAEHGLGFLIFTSRQYLATDLIFVGILMLGLLGFAGDTMIRFLARAFFRRFLVAGRA